MTERLPTDPHETDQTPFDLHLVRSGIAEASLKQTLPDILVLNEKAPFEHGLEASRKLYERIGIAPPPLEAFEQSGVDFDRLFRQWTKIMQDGLDPVAVFAKTDISIEEARALFAHLRADKNIENNPLQRHEIRFPKIINGVKQLHTEVHDGLDISSGIAENWQEFTAPQPGLKTTDGWSLRLIASNLTPQKRGMYTNKSRTSKNHPTIPEELTLQAVRIQDGEPPTDPGVMAWLEGGTFMPHYLVQPRAPISMFNHKEGCLVIGHHRVVDNEIPTRNHLRLARS